MRTYNTEPSQNNEMVEYLMTNHDLHAGWMQHPINSKITFFMNGNAYVPNLKYAMYDKDKTFTAIKEDFSTYEKMDRVYISSIKKVFDYIKNNPI